MKRNKAKGIEGQLTAAITALSALDSNGFEMNQADNELVVAYIGLGSNLADPVSQVKAARRACASLPGVQELAFSGLYRSSPMGPRNQPDYVNAVMSVSTARAAIDLLRALQTIEHEQGRVRTGERWGPRTLDLDLLIYGDQQIELPDLVVPHPGIAERAFVLYPLYAIAPQMVVPGKGLIADLIANCPVTGLQKID